MSATSLLSELRTAGVIVTATSEGDLELDAPRGFLTETKLNVLRRYKAEIIILLSRRCPLCGHQGTQQEQSIKGGLHYVDTYCFRCGELIECFIPSQ